MSQSHPTKWKPRVQFKVQMQVNADDALFMAQCAKVAKDFNLTIEQATERCLAFNKTLSQQKEVGK